jgi:hypothetical protein
MGGLGLGAAWKTLLEAVAHGVAPGMICGSFGGWGVRDQGITGLSGSWGILAGLGEV